MDKKFKSHFIDEQLDVANYITEFLIKKFAAKQNISLPSYPFWRKVYREKNSKQLDTLADRYSKEIIAIQRLLKVFDASVILSYLRETSWYSLFYLNTEFQKTIVFDLYKKQSRLDKSAYEKTEEAPVVTEPELKTFTGTSTGSSKKGLIGNL